MYLILFLFTFVILRSQIIWGCSFANYSSSTTTYNIVITSAVSSSINVLGLTASNIKNLVVVAASGKSSRRLEGNNDQDLLETRMLTSATISKSLSINYIIITTAQSLSYTSLSNALLTSLQNGQFTSNLNRFALSQGTVGLKAPAFSNSTGFSSSVLSSSLSSPNSQATISPAVIAAIVVVLVVLPIILYFFYIRAKQVQSAGIDSNKESVAVEMKPTSNPMINNAKI